MIKIQYSTISETGKRQNNEDAFRMVSMADGNRWLALVCDGMGGHANGEIASKTVADSIVDYWEKTVDEIDSKSKVEKACRKARITLDECSFAMKHVKMGTTMVMASIEGDTVTIAHLGDSRCYLMRPVEGLLYRTRDHIRMECGWEIIDRCFLTILIPVSVFTNRPLSTIFSGITIFNGKALTVAQCYFHTTGNVLNFCDHRSPFDQLVDFRNSVGIFGYLLL